MSVDNLYHFNEFRFSGIVKPEAVYCCLTGTTFCYYIVMCSLKSLYCLPNCYFLRLYQQVSLLYTLWFTKWIDWGCLLLFYKNYIVYQIVYMFLWSEFIGCCHFTKLCYSTPSSFWMYCLRLLTILFTTMFTVVMWCVHWKVCVHQVLS